MQSAIPAADLALARCNRAFPRRSRRSRADLASARRGARIVGTTKTPMTIMTRDSDVNIGAAKRRASEFTGEIAGSALNAAIFVRALDHCYS